MDFLKGGTYTERPSDCSAWSHKHKRCSRGISPCLCPLFSELSYATAVQRGSLRDWIDRVVDLQRAEGLFEPDAPGPPRRANEITVEAIRIAGDRGKTREERMAIYDAEIDRLTRASPSP